MAKHEVRWIARVLLSTQHGPGKPQRMRGHHTVESPCQDAMLQGVEEWVKLELPYVTPNIDGRPGRRTDVSAVHLSILITREVSTNG